MQKRKMMLLGNEIDVTDVEIVDRKEQVSEYKLEDGAVIRVGSPATRITRIEGQWNADGNPIYIVIQGIATTVISAPPRSGNLTRSHRNVGG